MISSKSWPWVALALLAGGLAAGPAATAQTIEFKYGNTRTPEDPSAALSRHIRTLAASPRNLSALKGAAAASLELGDPQTALTFLARAEEVAPRDGEVKAGMGSAFVLMEEPEAALRFFAEAEALGEAEATFAKDRGLAYDLTGDPRRAQADYAIALKRRDEPETRERLALSLAISGDREGALAAIDRLVRNQNRSAWRTRAFVLALTGDAAGATEAAQAVMPNQAAQWRPFFARLPALKPADRALAVHFGRFPAENAADVATGAGEPIRQAQNSPTQAGQPDPGQTALGTNSRTRRAASAESRGRPDRRATPASRQNQAAGGDAARKPIDQKMDAKTAASGGAERKIPGAASSAPTPPSIAATETAAGSSASSAGLANRSASSAPARAKTATAKKPPAAIPFGPPTPGTPPSLAQLTAEREAASQGQDTHTEFASVAATVQALPAPVRTTPPKPSAQAAQPASKSVKPELAKAGAKADGRGKKDTPAIKKAGPAKPREPSRIWVQVAGGANKADLPKAFNQLKAKAPKLLGGRTAWTTPLRATNRLLVGPFKTEKEARTFVNDLAKLKLDGFSWTSPEGQEITRLPAK